MHVHISEEVEETLREANFSNVCAYYYRFCLIKECIHSDKFNSSGQTSDVEDNGNKLSNVVESANEVWFDKFQASHNSGCSKEVLPWPAGLCG